MGKSLRRKLLQLVMTLVTLISKGDFNIGMPNHILHILNFTIKTNSYSLGKPSPFIAKKIHKICRFQTHKRFYL